MAPTWHGVSDRHLDPTQALTCRPLGQIDLLQHHLLCRIGDHDEGRAGDDEVTRLGGRQGGPGALADQLALLLSHGGVDPHHQIIGARHVGSADREPVLQKLRQRVGAAGDPVQPSRHKDGTQLSIGKQKGPPIGVRPWGWTD